MDPEIRWKQRLAHYRKAYGRLAAAVSLANEGLFRAFLERMSGMEADS